MGEYTQDNRFLAVETSLGPDALLLERLSGTEGVSELFRFRLGLLAEKPAAFERVLGAPVTVTLRPNDGRARHIHGIVSEFAQGRRVAAADEKGVFIRYRATVVPRLWLLTRRRQCRIWQGISVPDILRELFRDWRLETTWELAGTYRPRNYCVQYRESDFQFVSRLLEEEGIAYYFRHGPSSHTLVLTDALGGEQAAQSQPLRLTFDPDTGHRDGDRVTTWEKTQRIRSCRVTLRDHCFELPGQTLETKALIARAVAAGSVPHQLATPDADRLELYEYPGQYAHHFDGVAAGGGDHASHLTAIFEENDRLSKLRVEEEAARALRINASGTTPALAPGGAFQLDRHFDGGDGLYYVLRVWHEAVVAGEYTRAPAGRPAPPAYRNRFVCLPDKVHYRPPRRAWKGRVAGTQTATVVGLPGQEVFCDKYGRIKVQFHWDRHGQHNADSSCWLRVAQAWAGKGFGMITVPRVGQDVIVDFLEGDPDKPIVVGCVYNADQVPPFKLPEHADRVALKTRSVGGHADNFSGLAVRDTPGREEVHLHAEKNLLVTAEHDHALTVADKQVHSVGDRYELTVGGEETPEAPGSIWQKIFGPGSTTAAGGHVDYMPKAGVFLKSIYGLDFTTVLGGDLIIAVPFHGEVVLGIKFDFTLGMDFSVTIGNENVVTLGAVTRYSREVMWESHGHGYKRTGKGPIEQETTGAITILAGETMRLYSTERFSAVSSGPMVIGAADIGVSADKGDVLVDSEIGAVRLTAGKAVISVGKQGIIQLTSLTGISLSCGANAIALRPNGIFVNGIRVNP